MYQPAIGWTKRETGNAAPGTKRHLYRTLLHARNRLRERHGLELTISQLKLLMELARHPDARTDPDRMRFIAMKGDIGATHWLLNLDFLGGGWVPIVVDDNTGYIKTFLPKGAR